MTMPPVRTRTRARPYEVGYARTPVHSRFKTGNPGGPGRPKGSTSLLSDFQKLRNEQIVATVNGRQTTMTKREALLRVLFEQALKGHFASLCLIFKLESTLQLDAQENTLVSAAPRSGLTSDERRLLKAHLDRMKSRKSRADQ